MQTAQYVLHGPDICDQSVEFTQLTPTEFLPALGGRRLLAKPKEKPPDFAQSKTQLTRPLDHRQVVENGCVVAPLAADSVRRAKNSYLFVVTNCRRPQSKPPRNLRN